MKDRPAVDAVAPNSSAIVSLRAAPVRLVLAHFWKILAATSVIGGLCVWYGVVYGRNGAHEVPVTATNSEDSSASRGHPHHFRLIGDLIDKQSQPATIV